MLEQSIDLDIHLLERDSVKARFKKFIIKP